MSSLDFRCFRSENLETDGIIKVKIPIVETQTPI